MKGVLWWEFVLLSLAIVTAVLAFPGQEVLAQDNLGFVDAPGSPIPVKEAWYGAIGDFNEDGHLDIAVLAGTRIRLLLGNGDGTFQRPTTAVPIEKGAWNCTAITAGDFNNDGHLDLVVSNPGTGQEDVGSVGVFLLKGDGKGNLSQAGFVPTGFHPTKVAISDFDKDGNMDVAVACSNFMFGHRVSLLFGNGEGGFERHDVMLPLGATVDDVATADFNGDGWTDLAVPCGRVLFVLLADPTQGRGKWFSQYTEYKLKYSSNSLAVGDFDGDGDIDLAISADDHLITMMNNEEGKFVIKSVMNTPNVYMSFHTIAGDLNKDSNLDLAILAEMGGVIGVYLGDGDGNFHLPVWALFSVKWSNFEATMSNLKDDPISVPASIKSLFNDHGVTLSLNAWVRLIQEATWQIIDKSDVYLLRREGGALGAYGSSSPVIPQCSECWGENSRRQLGWEWLISTRTDGSTSRLESAK